MSRLRDNARYAHALLGPEGTLAREAAMATLFPKGSDWVVGALSADGEGEIFETVFVGPKAKERAVEYASEKYSGFREKGEGSK